LVRLTAFAASVLLASAAWAGPEIHHSPPKVEANSDLTIRAKITAAGGVIEPTLYFRKSGREFSRVALSPKSRGNFEARIPAAFLAGAETLEYYIGAFSAKDLSEGFWRSKESPYKLSLKIAEQHLLHLSTEPPNAILDLDNVTVGPSPYNAPVSPGSHHVTARLSGYKLLDFDFNMPKDRDLSLPFSLMKETGTAPPPVVEPKPEPKPEPKAEPIAVAPKPEPKPELKPEPIPDPPAAVAPKPPPPAVTEASKPVAPPPEGMARVRIVSVPPGAKIAVDGKDSGIAPVELVLAPGAYIVSAKLDAFRPADQVLKLGPGDAAVRVITLRAAAAKAAQK
jgi:hypothetical protein